MLKTVFFGTPDIAVPFLEALARQSSVCAVVTKPDVPAGRGHSVQASAVKNAALTLNLPVLQPESVKDLQFVSKLQGLGADVVFVVAYGKLLPTEVLSLPRLGFLNVHFSLLPKYRGAAPIQRAIMNGDTETGVTLFWLDEGMDTGPVLNQIYCVIEESDDAESMRVKLVALGLQALQDAIRMIESGEVPREAQVGEGTKAPMLTKEEGRVDWSLDARHIFNLIRGTNPWPGAFTLYGTADKKMRLKIIKAEVVAALEGYGKLPAGALILLENNKTVLVKCGQQFLRLATLQPEGKKAMASWDFLQGARLKTGDLLG